MKVPGHPVTINTKFKFKTGLSYHVNISDIEIIDQESGMRTTLNYPEAAVLDLLIKEYPSQTVTQMISKICFCTISHAQSIIIDTIESLLQFNLIILE